jgi:hypothetical protein
MSGRALCSARWASPPYSRWPARRLPESLTISPLLSARACTPRIR